MTTVTATTTRSQLGEAGGAARQIRERFKSVAAGGTDEQVRDDMIALAVTLESAATTYATGGAQSPLSYTLSWTTSGANDAATKAFALAWLHGPRKPPGFGAQHLDTRSTVPKLGSALLTLINGL